LVSLKPAWHPAALNPASEGRTVKSQACDYALWVPEDAVAAELKKGSRGVLDIMQAHMGAETAPTSDLTVGSWLKALDKQGVR
jgi:hypothetical protein